MKEKYRFVINTKFHSFLKKQIALLVIPDFLQYSDKPSRVIMNFGLSEGDSRAENIARMTK